MTHEQRAAAERVRRAVEANRTFDVQVLGCANEEFEFRQFFRDIQLLAINVALAEHLADDDEPATLDRLEELFHDSRCTVAKHGLRFFVRFSGSVEVKSEGDARRLLAALEGR